MIFVAAREDLPSIVKMALKIPNEMNFDAFPEPDVVKITRTVYNNWINAPIFVYKEASKQPIRGFVGLHLSSFWWSEEPVFTDYAFYIEPEFRNTKVVGELIGAIKDFSKLNKTPFVTNFISTDRTELKQKLFERKGFKPAGFVATYGV